MAAGPLGSRRLRGELGRCRDNIFMITALLPLSLSLSRRNVRSRLEGVLLPACGDGRWRCYRLWVCRHRHQQSSERRSTDSSAGRQDTSVARSASAEEGVYVCAMRHNISVHNLCRCWSSSHGAFARGISINSILHTQPSSAQPRRADKRLSSHLSAAADDDNTDTDNDRLLPLLLLLLLLFFFFFLFCLFLTRSATTANIELTPPGCQRNDQSQTPVLATWLARQLYISRQQGGERVCIISEPHAS